MSIDGRIDLAEYKAWHRAHGLDDSNAEELFHDLDLNHDGSISTEEHISLLRQFFKSEDPAAPGNKLFGPL